MADDVVMRLTPKQLQSISDITRMRERKRIAEEIDGHAAVEDALGNIDIGEKMRVLAESIRSEGVKKKLTPEEARKEGERLLVSGMETLPFPGYDGAAGDDLPPMREHSDRDEISTLVRKLDRT